MWSSRREDPEVRIELPIEPDVFSCDLSRATKSNFQIAETEKKLVNLLTNVKTKMRGKTDNQKVKWLTRSVELIGRVYLIVYLERKRGRIELPGCIFPAFEPVGLVLCSRHESSKAWQYSQHQSAEFNAHFTLTKFNKPA